MSPKRCVLRCSFLSFIMICIFGTIEGILFRRDVRVVPKRLVVKCIFGLGNRLRCAASAVIIAREQKKELTLIWVPDIHLNEAFYDIFLESSAFTVVESDQAGLDSLEDGFRTYDLSKTWVQIPNRDENIYIIACGRMESTTRIDAKEQKFRFNEALNMFVPTRAIQLALEHKLPQLGDIRTYIGVHMRNIKELSDDVPGLIDPVLDAEARKQRARCHEIHFAHIMMKILNANPHAHFFVAADDHEASRNLKQIMPEGTAISTSTPCDESRRSKKCVESAVIDLLLLSMTKELIVSSWSSFSEVAIARGGFEDHQVYRACI